MSSLTIVFMMVSVEKTNDSTILPQLAQLLRENESAVLPARTLRLENHLRLVRVLESPLHLSNELSSILLAHDSTSRAKD